MADTTDRITVFRSADETAEDDANGFYEILKANGIQAAVHDDTSPGVPSGAWEVSVPAAEQAQAERLLDRAGDSAPAADDSSALDLETVFSAPGGTTHEFEAAAVKTLLENAGITAIMVGDSVLPNLAFEVRVPREQAGEARHLIAEAEASGPAAAEAAERSTE